MEVDEESKNLSVNIYKGLFQFNHLPFEVKTTPAIFQQTMDDMLTGLT